jgi:diguanylate cyclase (GGDEF)-like protein/hemerythrin-like metal-binding protein
MDTVALAFSVILTGTAVAVLSLFLAAFRKERGMWIYASAFLAAVAGFLLLMLQRRLSPWIGVILANSLIVFFHFGLAWGLRSCLGRAPGWPRRFWLYGGCWLAAMIAFTFFRPAFAARGILVSAAAIVGSGEFLIALTRADGADAARRSMLPVLRRTGALFVGAYLALYAARIVLIARYAEPDTRILDSSGLATFTFAFTSFYLVIWAGLILIIDAAQLLGQLAEKNRLLEGLATTDQLTGLFNRRMLDERAEAELERAARYGTPMSLVMFDLDHFKRVNDNWGHQAGDEVLKEVSALTRSLIREPDKLFRWGGEEFVVLAPHTDAEGAAVLAEKLRRTIASHRFPAVGAMTASFGVAQWRHADSLALWFGHVDLALYRAKNSGRDRVVRFDPSDRLPAAAVRFTWREEWSSGSDLLDGEHRRLLELANDLLDHSLSGSAPELLGTRLDALIRYVGDHFADEERLLAAASYPYLSAHAELHRKLEADARELKVRSERGETPPGVLLDFLVGRVVTDHLLKEDTKFFPYLRGKGPQTVEE